MSFQTAYFMEQPPTTAFGAATHDWSKTRTDTRERVSREMRVPDRSKSILVPPNVDHPGIHVPARLVAGKVRVDVDPSLAVVHHYRVEDKFVKEEFAPYSRFVDEAFETYSADFKPRHGAATAHFLTTCRHAFV